MILKVFERLLNIDDIDYKWAVRFMFLFCVVARCAVFFNPYSDTDFTWLNSWMSNFESADQTQAMDMTIPITSGNIVFLVSAFFVLFITLLMGVLYSGLYVRSFRSRSKGKEWSEDLSEHVKMGVIIKRFVLLDVVLPCGIHSVHDHKFQSNRILLHRIPDAVHGAGLLSVGR